MSIMVVPNRIRDLGRFTMGAEPASMMNPADLKILMLLSTKDLLRLGQMISAGRKIVSQKMGGLIGQLKPALDFLGSVRSTLSILGMKADESTLEATAEQASVFKASSDAVTLITDQADIVLDGIARLVSSREQSWQVGYTRYTSFEGVQVVGSGVQGGMKLVSLDFPGQSLWDCVEYLYDNRGLVDTVKKASAEAGLSGLPLVIGIVVVILALILAIYNLAKYLMDSKSREAEKLRDAKRKNVETRVLNQVVIDQRQSELNRILNTPPEERTQSDAGRIAALKVELNSLTAANAGLEAQDNEIDKSLEQAKNADDIVERLNKAVGSGMTVLTYGLAGLGLLLAGYVTWKVIA